MNESILTSIKKLIGGIPEDYTQFDEDIITQINLASVLHDLGVGPADGFTVTDKEDFWEDFMEDGPVLNKVKTYVQLKTRLLFDPPTISSVLTAMENQVSELEWRLQVECDEDWGD